MTMPITAAHLAERSCIIFDPSHVNRARLLDILKGEGLQCSCVLTIAECMSKIMKSRPDFLFINVRLGPDISGIKVLEEYHTGLTGICAVMISDDGDFDLTREALRKNAFDVIRAPFDRIRIANTIREFLRANASQSANSRKSGEQLAGLSTLTPRERDVLDLILLGNSNKETARLLGISDRTVEVHRARCMKKVGARNSTDLAIKALNSRPGRTIPSI